MVTDLPVVIMIWADVGSEAKRADVTINHLTVSIGSHASTLWKRLPLIGIALRHSLMRTALRYGQIDDRRAIWQLAGQSVNKEDLTLALPHSSKL